ncbi:hypothetical protein ACHAPA_006404 [Fusarium lateritium]
MFTSRFPIALVALLSFIATSSVNAYSGSGEGGFPDFITQWPLFQRWQSMTDSIPEFDVPGLDDVSVGDYVLAEKKLTWMCYTLQAETTPLVPTTGSVVIEKATLSYNEDGEDKTDTVVSKRSYSDMRAVLYGAKLQKSLSHPNILPIHHFVVGRTARRTYGFALMPYVAAGSLENNYASYADQGAIDGAFKQMLSAVAAVSAAGIIHRDLKPENFLKDGDDLKLMDFDQSRDVDTTAQMDVGTPSYTAPEIISGVDYSTKADTFSLGMSYLVMSVSDLRNSDARFQLWKDVIEPSSGSFYPSASKIEEILKERNYGVFSGNDGLLQVIAKSLCKAEERYAPGEFETAFGAAV